ncbi:hypothetical protein CLU79DRAFT_764310 [Phycomyces nitens]|nr:hypothetical protein CLU79DRAFT_764310 [Phycomyces nitens]
MPINSCQRSGRKIKVKQEETPLRHVSAGRIEHRQVAPRPLQPLIQYQQNTELSKKLETIENDIGMIRRHLDNLIDNQNTTPPAPPVDSRILAPRPSTTPHYPIAMSPHTGSPGPSSKEMTAIILELIGEKIWKKSLESDDLALIEENERKEKWNKDEKINHPDNVQVIRNVKDYILSHPLAAGIWPGLIIDKIKNNYKYFHHTCHMTPEQTDAKRRKLRSNSRIKEILTRRTAIYNDHWRVIDEEMGHGHESPAEMAYSNLLQKEVMSDGESDLEELTPGYHVRVLNVARPSWRSDELNRFLEIIDRIGLECNLKKASLHKPRMPRFQKTVKHASAPTTFSPLPSWTIKDEQD